MKLNIRSQKFEITDAIRDYLEKKLSKLDKYFDDPNNLSTNIVIRPKGVMQTVEVTINFKKIVLRAEESNKDLYASIDLVVDKIERQIRKNKTRMRKNRDSIKEFNLDFDITQDEEVQTEIVRRKMVEMKPMNEEEAILQMELLGHDFFVFKNTKDNLVNILYKRKDGNYGIMEIN